MAYVSTSLDGLIRDYMIMQGNETEHGYERLYNIAIRGAREISLDVARETRTAEIEIDTNTRSITLPQDFMVLQRVGIKKYGRFQPLAKDDSLVLGNQNQFADYSAGVESVPTTDAADPATGELDTSWYGPHGEHFGAGGGQNSNGYYRFDHQNENIYFSSNVAGPIILEYIGVVSVASVIHTNDNGLGVTSATGVDDWRDHITIPEQCREALIAYIYWCDIKMKRDIPQNEKQAARRDWFNEKRLARARMHDLRKDEILRISRKGFKASPKL